MGLGLYSAIESNQKRKQQERIEEIGKRSNLLSVERFFGFLINRSGASGNCSCCTTFFGSPSRSWWQLLSPCFSIYYFNLTEYGPIIYGLNVIVKLMGWNAHKRTSQWRGETWGSAIILDIDTHRRPFRMVCQNVNMRKWFRYLMTQTTY